MFSNTVKKMYEKKEVTHAASNVRDDDDNNNNNLTVDHGSVFHPYFGHGDSLQLC